MEMHQVRYFLALCETFNFTRAAKQCGVAQPSLTRAIKKLEDELGGELFRRERTRTHMTDLARLVRPHLTQILEANQAVRAEAHGFKNLDKAPLRLGVMCTIGPARMVGYFNRLRQEISALDVSLTEGSGQEMVDDLLAGNRDIALVGLPRFPDRLDVRPLYTERYVIAFPRGHRFERMNGVSLKDLDQEDYLERVNCEAPHYFDAAGLEAPEVRVRYRSEREDWIQGMVMAGLGCSMVPEYLPIMPGLATRPLLDTGLTRTVSLVTVAGRRFAPAVEAFIRLAHRHDW